VDVTESKNNIDGLISITHSDQPSADDVASVSRILNSNNQRFGHTWASSPLSVVMKDSDGNVVGGLIGSTNWGWLHVDLLAVDESLRGSGYGAKLLATAESIARERGCTFAYLDTFSFQAQSFYEKYGYVVWGRLDDFPTGASRIFLKKTLTLFLSLAVSLTCGLSAMANDTAVSTTESKSQSKSQSKSKVKWRDFDPSVFAEAKRDHKFVLLDLEAVWCHWCHVMDAETYSNSAVQKLLNSKYICVRVDQDARPDLSNKYEEYGWPATIIFNEDGAEIVKRSGYINPERMARLLSAIVKDPSPEEVSTTSSASAKASSSSSSSSSLNNEKSALSGPLRQELIAKHVAGNDPKYGAWGTYQKFLDFDSVEYAMVQGLAGDVESKARAIAALDGEINLIDPAFGGVYQYSTDGDWSHPHFEKIMQTQAENLRLYALAYRLYGEERYLKAAKDIARYLQDFLSAPDGAFYTSQDADVVSGVHSGEYFTLGAAERLKQGLPRIDKHCYARENGWATLAFAELYLASGDKQYLQRAIKAADWAVSNRQLKNDASNQLGFSHGDSDKAGPFLGDTLAMGRAFLTLYRATGERKWLNQAVQAANFIDSQFKTATLTTIDENVQLARFTNLLYQYTGEKKYRALSEQALSYLALPETARRRKVFVAGILLADQELQAEPIHITVVGAKKDIDAQALFSSAAALPAPYMRIEWSDKSEGPLPNSAVELPQLPKAAAFLCNDGRCSTPAFTTDALKRLFERSKKSKLESDGMR
jgi:uncharacterized protein YyaL (SSP411 family)/ribosomal protein S18 acetylase RimI-like enzyme